MRKFKLGLLSVFSTLTIAMALPFYAYADEQPTAYAQGFIEAMAEESGISSGDFVASTILIQSALTGVAPVTQYGVQLGDSLANSVNNLIDAADYPAWNTLTETQQQNWGSEVNYNSAKYNSLLAAFGLDDARDRFYSSGGGQGFTWQQQELDKIQQIGALGSNWINGVGNTVQDLLDTLTPDAYTVFENYYGVKTFKEIDASQISEWPARAPTNIIVNYGNRVVAQTPNDSYYSIWESSVDVYIVCGLASDNNHAYCYMFDKDGFYANYVSSRDINAQVTNKTSANSYNTYGGWYSLAFESSKKANAQFNMSQNTFTENQWQTLATCLGLLLQNEVNDLGATAQPNIVDYPSEQLDPDLYIYFPTAGVGDSINWDDLITEVGQISGDVSEIVRLLQQFKFYATYELKVHDAGIYDSLTDISQQLEEIKNAISFNASEADEIIGEIDYEELEEKATDLVETISDLAPFGSMLAMSEMVAILSQTGNLQEPVLEVPFNFMPGEEYTVILDFTWLDDLKPVINLFCIILLLMALFNASIRVIELEAAG